MRGYKATDLTVIHPDLYFMCVDSGVTFPFPSFPENVYLQKMEKPHTLDLSSSSWPSCSMTFVPGSESKFWKLHFVSFIPCSIPQRILIHPRQGVACHLPDAAWQEGTPFGSPNPPPLQPNGYSHMLSATHMLLRCRLFFLLFYWSIVDLHCWINFSCTAKWFSYTHMYIIFHILVHYDLS